MPPITRFSGLVVTLAGGGSKGHSPIKSTGQTIGLDIQCPVNQTANPFQITKPDGTVIYAIGPGGVGGAQSVQLAQGPIPVTGGDFTCTSAGINAYTLAAPTQDGVRVRLMSATPFAHTLTATGLLQTGSAATDKATFAAFAGANIELRSLAGKWQVLSQVGITFS